VIAKLEGAQNMFIAKQKYMRSAGESLVEPFHKQVARLRDEKTAAWRKNGGQDPSKEQRKEMLAGNEVELTRQQELQIEAEATRKVERERAVQGGGVKLLREKLPFIW
jgi:hypothetical protein